jgi:hypothetical protein
MHENRAAAALHARRGVKIQHDEDVVKIVLAPKALRARGIWKPYASVVIAITDSVAPALVLAHTSYRQSACWTPTTIGAINHLAQAPNPGRRGAVAFAFMHATT